MGLPHVLQNAVAKLRAWGRSKRTTDAPPRIHRSAEAFTITSQECAVPVAFRQREQWQFRKRSNGPSTSNATSPHRQLPRNAAILASSRGMKAPATVKVQKLNPVTQVVFDNAVIVDHTGDEKTAVRFTLDDSGKVTDVNSRWKSLMETFRNMHRNGADLDPKTGYMKKL
jgi:hypothetical protein